MSFAPSLPIASLTSSTDNPTPTYTSVSGRSGTSSMTLLFGSLVIFSSLFAAFLLLCFFWRYRRARHRGTVLEYDETIGTYRGVPNMWEVWIQGEPSGSQRDWGSVRPLSVDVEHAPRVNPEPTTSPASRWRRLLWNRFRRPNPPSDDGVGAASAPLSSLRMSFIIAMPRADPPNRRHSVISQGPSVNGDWGNREYAIGVYHAPFREESSL